MKKLLLTLLFGSLVLGESYAQKLTAYFSYCTFRQAEGSPFVETYLTVVGNSVKYLPNANQKFQSKIEIQWLLKSGDDIVFADKYNLLSPEMESETGVKSNFLDQQRIPAKNGNYSLELTISDKNTEGSRYTMKQDLNVDYPDDKLVISDIQLLESYQKSEQQGKMTKNGFLLIPMTNNFFSEEDAALKFYVELYHSNIMPGEDFLVRYYLINSGNNQIQNEQAGFKKMQPQKVNALLAEISLSQVISGNYALVVEARNKSNELLARKSVFFQRSKPLVRQSLPADYMMVDQQNTFVGALPADSMKEYVSCLFPISTPSEKTVEANVIGLNDPDAMKKFFYYFWAKRDPQNPEKAWTEYKQEVDKVNAAYSTLNRKGYETDRGRVYLQYGPPNTIDKGEFEPNTYPYEIWHYYVINNQTNRKFVFYLRYLSSNNYELLHSDVSGEISAYDWQVLLHQKINQFGDVDKTTSPSSWGDRTQDKFEMPK